MQIVSIHGYHVECALPRPVRNSVSRFEKRGALVVEVRAGNGMSGWGECTHFPETVWTYLRTMLTGKLLGQDPRATGRHYQAMIGQRATGDISMMAISALDMALWDLRGRIEGVPVSTLLGGRARDRLKAYASGPFMKLGDDPYEGFADEAEAYAKLGFCAIKARSGATPAADAAMVAALRQRLGPDMGLMVDMNRGYARAAALDAARRLEDAGLLWIEEPLQPDDFDGYRMLAQRTAAPLAAGEALGKLSQFQDFLALGAVSVIQPDLYLAGGFTGVMKVAALAEAANVPLVPHVWGTAVNFHASLQLASVLPGARLGDGTELPMFEWDRSDNALLRVAGEPALSPDGTIGVPDGPGIGIDLTAAMFEPFVRAGWSVSA